MQPILKIYFKYHIGIFFGLICLSFILIPITATGCTPHIDYFEEKSKQCNGYAVGNTEIWEHYSRTCNCSPTGGCDCCRNERHVKTCADWQIAQTGYDYGLCKCEKECLNSPQAPIYYDNNAECNNGSIVNGTLYQDASNGINLPIILSWDNIDGWQNLGEYTTKKLGYYTNGPDPNTINYGPRSYRIQIQSLDDAKTNTYGTKTLNLSEAKNYDTETIGSFETYVKVLPQNAFNSRDDGGACFFQTNSAYRWRVLPCCDANGTDCREDGIQWWKFSTSPAPELLGIKDDDQHKNGTTDDIAQDPDWNGPLALENVDFCSAKLFWCKAKLVDDTSHFYSTQYNDGKLNYATNYQIRFKSSENWKLGIRTKAGQGVSWLKNLVTNPTETLTKLFQPNIQEIANEPITDEDKNNEESCSYLQRKTDNKGNVIACRPEPMYFSISEIDELKTPGFKPSYSTSSKISDRQMFTGDLNYSWQVKSCFDLSAHDSCTKYEEYQSSTYDDYEKRFGQRWEFITINKKIEPPTLIKPKNSTNTINTDTLIGIGDILEWSVPCGAHSYIFDVQDESGATIFGAEENNRDKGRVAKTNSISIDLQKASSSIKIEQDDPEKIILVLDTKYRWHVKSCWPSVLTEDSDLACGAWSDWSHFKTTGKPPESSSLNNDTGAPATTLSWNDVMGARSYRVQIAGEEKLVVDKAELLFTYSSPKKYYTWKIKTCADDEGAICGDKWAAAAFTTGDFDKPNNLSPLGNVAQIEPLRWDSPAKYFLVTASVTNGEKSTSCEPDWFNGEYKERVVSGTSLAIKTAAKGASPYCAGDYSFTVRPCFDDKCTSKSYNFDKQSFSIASKEQSSGLMVCGQATNNPKTQYNEKEPCEIRHLVLGLKVIIDFVVFKLAFMLLPVMAAITGGLFYLSQDKANLIPHIKDAWKKIGIGYGILFFSWIIVSVLMLLAGYTQLWNQIL